MFDVLNAWKRTKEPMTHDYTNTGWGHDYTYKPGPGGQTAEMSGWGHGIKVGDYIAMASPGNFDGCSLYKVVTIKYCRDPSDMWFASVEFAKRVQCKNCEKVMFESESKSSLCSTGDCVKDVQNKNSR